MFVNCCIFEQCYIPENGKFQPSQYLSGTIFDVNCTQKSLSLSPTVLSAWLLFWTVARHAVQKKDRDIRHLAALSYGPKESQERYRLHNCTDWIGNNCGFLH
jgi:hypothetical protein